MQALFGPFSLLLIVAGHQEVRIPLAMQALFGRVAAAARQSSRESGYPLLCKPFSDPCFEKGVGPV